MHQEIYVPARFGPNLVTTKRSKLEIFKDGWTEISFFIWVVKATIIMSSPMKKACNIAGAFRREDEASLKKRNHDHEINNQDPIKMRLNNFGFNHGSRIRRDYNN